MQLLIFMGVSVALSVISMIRAVKTQNLKTFEEGIWYSFAIVTTIGLGDYTVTTTIGRILSITLRTYGIVVVASITSVIVNYYNEVKNENKSKKDKGVITMEVDDDDKKE